MNKSKLTIIIPSINRPKYLERAISYWEQSNFEIIIATNLELIHPTIKIINSNGTFLERIRLALLETKTQYCLICPDDDFLGFRALEKSIHILDEDENCSSVVGNVSSFYFKSDGTINYSVLNIVPSHCESDVNLRIASGFLRYSNNYWVVYRKSLFDKIISIAFEVKNFNVVEMIFKLSALIEGKICSNDSFFWLREVIPNSWGGRESSGLKFLEDEENKEDLQKLITKVNEKFGNKAIEPVQNMINSYKNFMINKNKPISFLMRLKSKIIKIISYGVLNSRNSKLILKTTHEEEDFIRMKMIIEKFGPL